MIKIYIPVILLFLIISFNSFSQKIFSCESKYDADFTVFVTDSKYDADLLVYKVDRKYDVDGNKGLWYFAESKYDADLLIYFVDSKYDAEWRKRKKIHLLF